MSDHQQTVDGLILPAPLGGHPALEFCNTWAGWNGPPARDYLESYDHLAVWAGAAELLDGACVADARRVAARDPAAALNELERARALRRDWYAVVRAPGEPGAAFDAVAQAVADAAAALRLVQHDGGAALAVEPTDRLSAPRLAAAWSAGQLLLGPEPARVSACPGHGCGWLFLNPTGRRRWCTMTTCGNRAKARRFAARHPGG